MTFSRYLWAFSLLAIGLGYFCVKLEKIHLHFMVIGAVLVLSTLSYTVDIVTQRFSDAIAGSSDAERIAQNTALWGFFKDAPFFGHGLGSYTSVVIRSQEAPYSYEDQLGALAGQTGGIGICLLILLLIRYYSSALIAARSRLGFVAGTLCLLGFLLYGGFVNPQIISSTASVSFGFILALILAGPVKTSGKTPRLRNA